MLKSPAEKKRISPPFTEVRRQSALPEKCLSSRRGADTQRDRKAASSEPLQEKQKCEPAMKDARKSHLCLWLPLAWLMFVFCLALCADMLPLPEFDEMDWENPAQEPGAVAAGDSGVSHLLGTDAMGRDILSRLIFGARVSLTVGLLTPLTGLVIGGFLGMLAGYFRGKTESIIMILADIILAFPGLVLVLAVAFCLGPGQRNLIISLGILSIPAFCRVARAKTLSYADREFVLSAKMIGETDTAILFHEILPNIIMSLTAYALFVVAYMIMLEGALSFLGLSVPAPIPSWGGMIAEGREVLDQAPHVSLIPAFVMFLTVLSFNLIGDFLRERTDAGEGH